MSEGWAICIPCGREADLDRLRCHCGADLTKKSNLQWVPGEPDDPFQSPFRVGAINSNRTKTEANPRPWESND